MRKEKSKSITKLIFHCCRNFEGHLHYFCPSMGKDSQSKWQCGTGGKHQALECTCSNLFTYNGRFGFASCMTN